MTVGHGLDGRSRKGSQVNKSEFIDKLATHFAGNKRAAADALDAVVDTITREVAQGEKVLITGFGAFEKAVRPARMVRNPRTGEKIQAKETSVPKFRPGAALKAVVAGAKQAPKVTVVRAAATTAAAAATTKRTAKAAAKKGAATRAAKKTTRKRAAKKAAATRAAKTTTRKRAAKKGAKKTARKRPAAKKSTAATRKRAGKKAAATRARKTTVRKRAAKKGAKKTARKRTARER